MTIFRFSSWNIFFELNGKRSRAEPSRGDLKIIQLELWHESARLGLITKSFMYSYSFRNIFVIRKSCIKFLSSLWMPSNLALKWREVIFRNGFKVKRGVKGKKEKEKEIAIATRSILSIVKKRSQFVDLNSEGAFIFYSTFSRDISWKRNDLAVLSNCSVKSRVKIRMPIPELISTHFGIVFCIEWYLFFSVNVHKGSFKNYMN